MTYGSAAVLTIPSLAVEPGETLAIIGPNGAGKSTLLRVMGLLQSPTGGRIVFRSEEVTRENEPLIRRRMASVFQQPLLLNHTLYYNAALGLRLRGLGRGQIAERIDPWLERLGIAHLASRPARTLSGGEAQRASLARALALDPELLLLDEPFSSLDAPTRETLLLDLQQILRETGITTAFVTHDLHEARLLGNRVGVLHRGKLLQLGSSDQVFARPCTEEVAAIVGVANRIPATVESAENGLINLRIGDFAVRAKANLEHGRRVLVCVRAEDIRLERPGAERHSPERLNQIRGKIETVSPWMAQFRIAVRAGNQTLTALISKFHYAGLGLTEGDEVLAWFDPADVHLIGCATE
ncbi:MAG TPA: ABC transporter ATP-binding protein [Candidatus Eisenbacteria bacterium]|nr:ABC transporter ATP-binding protein [Candidatus Eisenbacteria bacterium]